MQRVLVLALMVGNLGCTTLSGPKTQSKWYALQKAEEAKCASWPMGEKDLQTDELNYVGGLKPGFLASGRKRDASNAYYFAPFDNNPEISADARVSLSLGRGALMIGGASVGASLLSIVIRNAPSGSTLEIRTEPENILKLKTALGEFQVVEGTVAQSAGGLWLTLKAEDNVHHLVFVETKNSAKLTSRIIPVTFSEQPRVLADMTRAGAILFWHAGERSKPFKAQILSEQPGNPPPAQNLDLTPQTAIESWNAVLNQGAFYLAAVDGDSLIGQATLRVSQVNLTQSLFTVAWTKDAPLKDVHATEPVFLPAKAGLEVLVLNWIDEESTIARYKVSAAGLGKPKYSGIFPKGARVACAFTSSEGNEYVVTRSRRDPGWAFQVCEI